ncbi:hypothetical protein A9Q86_07400 [Flavobacteriales bacterium 33_180_T64]|nr:hypothetical protein A9Q86_07400 [Flavobacteriales bacterium 33_180_T64]
MEIINKTFTSIERLVITEGGENYELLDSLIFRNQNSGEIFQMITNQKEFKTIRIEENYLLDGEYNPEKIEEKEIISEQFTIINIQFIEDETNSYIIAFVIQTESGKHHFIRLVDEINYVAEIEFKETLSSIGL